MYGRTLDGQVTIVDQTINGRENLYYGLSFQTFEGSELSPFKNYELQLESESSVSQLTSESDVVEEVLVDPNETTGELDLQTLRDKYEEKMGKAVPARYKNDREWIQSKLSA